jgi:hypothetical protein
VILKKFSAEVRLFDFDFSKMPEIVAGDTLSGALLEQSAASGAGAVALSAPAIDGAKVKFTISAGTPGALYRIVCTVTTLAGRTLVGVGDLQVN